MTDALELCIIEIPKVGEVSKIVEKNKEIKEAMEELEEISNDRRLRIIAELKEKAIKDENNGRVRYREEGLKERGRKAEKNKKK